MRRRIQVKLGTSTAHSLDVASSSSHTQDARPAKEVSLPLQAADGPQNSGKPECALLDGPEVDSVAVVGNGPISPKQRNLIANHSVVIR